MMEHMPVMWRGDLRWCNVIFIYITVGIFGGGGGPKRVNSYVHVHNCLICLFLFKKFMILMKILVDEQQANRIKHKMKKGRQKDYVLFENLFF